MPNKTTMSPTMPLQDDDNSAPPTAVCRFCLDGAEVAPLLTPCRCSGTQAHVHEHCLQRLVTTTAAADALVCQLCQTRYAVRRPAAASRWPAASAARARAALAAACGYPFYFAVTIATCSLLSYAVHEAVCHSKIVVPYCDEALVEDFYCKGADIGVMMLAVHAVCVSSVRGCRYWCVMTLEINRPYVYAALIASAVLSYMFDSSIAKSTGMYLVLTVASHNTLMCCCGGELHRRRAVRFQNRDDDDEQPDGPHPAPYVPPSPSSDRLPEVV